MGTDTACQEHTLRNWKHLLQEEMNGLLGEFSGDQEVRMLWGSFGDTNLRNESVRKCYYDDDTWRDLQALKKAVDGGDLFHTEFTVQLP